MEATPEALEDIRAHVEEIVYKTIIPRNVRLSEAPSFGQPILLYSPKSTGAEAYESVAEEVLARG